MTMKTFMAEDNLCAQNLLKLVSHGNAIIAEILRLKDHVPSVYLLDNKELTQKYQDVVMDFSYFKIVDVHEKQITTNLKMQDLDDDLKEKYVELITRFYLLFENIYQYVSDLNIFIEQLNDNAFIQQNMDSVMRDIEGKQLLCESLYLYGAMLLLCDVYVPGPARERLLVAFYRYSTSQSQSNVDEVCKLLRNTGYDHKNCKRPSDYPVEYFSRISLHPHLVEKVFGKLRSEDIYNQIAVYTDPEHQVSALAAQASMLVVCLFFAPHYLHTDNTKMREIVDKFFPSNWIIPIYMGVTINIFDYWDSFKAAKSALSNTCNNKMIKEVCNKKKNSVNILNNKIQQLLKEGVLTDDFVLDNINKILRLIIASNLDLRWLLLHTSNVVIFDTNKKSKLLKDIVIKESNYDAIKILELLVSVSEIELRIREILNRLLEGKVESWNNQKSLALEAIKNLSDIFSSAKPIAKITENERLKQWFDNIAAQVNSLGDTITTKSLKKLTKLIHALDVVEEFHGMKSTSAVVQYLSESKEALKNCIRISSLKEDSLVTLEIVADLSYAWCIIDNYTFYMQNKIKEYPAITSRLRSLFLKLASAMEIPLLRINQAHSEDLVSVSQYYSNELINYIQKVLQVIPEMVFCIVEKIINLQTWTLKEIPTRLEKEKLREFSQLEHRAEVAKLTHSASMFTTGVLDMSSTLVGVIRVDPAQLLEEGLLKELDRHISKKFEEFLEPNLKKPLSSSSLLQRLQKLSESMDGYKRSLEYIQDYINIHGLRIWQKQVSAIIMESVNKEISVRKGVTLYSPSASFMGSLARQIAHLADARTCAYINICTAWFDIKSQCEVVNTKTFSKINDAIGVVGLHGIDTLYGYMIKYQLNDAQRILHVHYDKLYISIDMDIKSIELAMNKGQRAIQQLTDVLVLVGTLQIIRRHIAYQLNTTCKFDSAHLEATLRTMNDSILNDLKLTASLESNAKMSPALARNIEEYLVRCGIYEPYEKKYLKHVHDLNKHELGRILALLLISQIPKLQFCNTTGDLISKKIGVNIDGYPLLVGINTFLKQAKTNHLEEFLNYICEYIKTVSITKMKTSDSVSEAAYLIRILEIICETFNVKYSTIENKLPLALLTQAMPKEKT